jgi:hypothetical protein
MTKKSFLFFVDNFDAVEELTNEDAGILLKTIVSYLNTGKVEKTSQLVRVVFIPIKNSIDRNNEKYAGVVEKRRLAGKSGGLAKASKRKQKVASASKGKQTVANLADSDNDSDSDSVSDSDITIINKELKTIVDHYNEAFGKRITSYNGFEKNFDHWIKVHNVEKIKLAIDVAQSDKFWRDKLTLQILFRRKNPRGEDVDFIEDLSNRNQSQQGNVAIL